MSNFLHILNFAILLSFCIGLVMVVKRFLPHHIAVPFGLLVLSMVFSTLFAAYTIILNVSSIFVTPFVLFMIFAPYLSVIVSSFYVLIRHYDEISLEATH